MLRSDSIDHILGCRQSYPFRSCWRFDCRRCRATRDRVLDGHRTGCQYASHCKGRCFCIRHSHFRNRESGTFEINFYCCCVFLMYYKVHPIHFVHPMLPPCRYDWMCRRLPLPCPQLLTRISATPTLKLKPRRYQLRTIEAVRI